MFKNFIIAALRSFRRNQFFTILNLLGLGLGTAIFIIVVLYARNELSYDKFNENYASVFRLDYIDDGVKWSRTTGPSGPILVNTFPEIAAFSRGTFYISYPIKYENSVVNLDRIMMHDSSAFKIFSFDFIQGDPETALITPATIVLTESAAKSIFGDKDPLNQIVKFANAFDCRVTGIIKDLPDQSHMDPQAIMSVENLNLFNGNENYLNNPNNYNYYTYLLIQEGIDIQSLEQKVSDLLVDRFEIDENDRFHLSSLKEVYFEPAENYTLKQGNLDQVYMYLAVGIITLLIAIINYINLSNGQAFIRAKELGIRKILGSSKKNIVLQILVEAIIFSLIAVNISFLFVELIKPYINNLLQVNLSIGYFQNPYVLLSILLFSIGLGFISGIFPATYISNFSALKSMNNEITHGKFGKRLRQFLIIIQFFIATSLLISTMVVSKQMQYIQRYNLGFDKEKLVFARLNRDLLQNWEVFKNELMEIPGIESICPSRGSYRTTHERWVGHLDTMSFVFHIEYGDPDYVKTLGLEIVNGRNFSHEMSTDSNKIIVNEAAANLLFGGKAVGKEIYNREIIGIVKNYAFETLHFNVDPLVIVNLPVRDIINIRFQSDQIDDVIKNMETIWSEMCPNNPLEYQFVDEYFARKYKQEIKSRKLFAIIALCAIIISSFGVIGLVTFTIQRRLKEIGVRKVNGAYGSHVMILLSKEITHLIIISSILAFPASWFIMNKWLQNFAFRIDFPIWTFFVAFILVWIAALLSIGYQTIKTARINPVEILRYE